ncbi:hypothetical protein BKA70DRAFT_58697 [Coprinopsis sp. MPI-PUGE-AT-0042]|nr:hypothetical protein BKA70DRAFT_58697 [Coprinopsis sp. MPI-PUGE-AT-0042]
MFDAVWKAIRPSRSSYAHHHCPSKSLVQSGTSAKGRGCASRRDESLMPVRFPFTRACISNGSSTIHWLLIVILLHYPSHRDETLIPPPLCPPRCACNSLKCQLCARPIAHVKSSNPPSRSPTSHLYAIDDEDYDVGSHLNLGRETPLSGSISPYPFPSSR